MSTSVSCECHGAHQWAEWGKDTSAHLQLSHATESGREAVMKLLILHDDVEVDSKDGNGCSLLSHATGSGHENVMNTVWWAFPKGLLPSSKGVF